MVAEREREKRRDQPSSFYNFIKDYVKFLFYSLHPKFVNIYN